jgi:cell division protein FtsB
MKLKEIGLILLALFLLVILVFLLSLSDYAAEQNEKLDFIIAELQREQVELELKHQQLRSDYIALQRRLCQAMIVGECQSGESR